VPPSRRTAAAPLADTSTLHLSIRQLQDRDLVELTEVFRDPDSWWFEYERGLDGTETEAFLDRQKRLWGAYGFGGCAVRDLQHRALLGVVGLGVPTVAHPSLPPVTIGWRFASTAWGHGYATEAAGALLDQAFSSMRIDAVGCVTNNENQRSVAVAQRLGMKPVGEVTGLRDDGLKTITALILRIDNGRWHGASIEGT
jgi:RimJ/RimL family protein N-acetyltransferase